jgi:hypothetical protein
MKNIWRVKRQPFNKEEVGKSTKNRAIQKKVDSRGIDK